jgi:hypothetical protein
MSIQVLALMVLLAGMPSPDNPWIEEMTPDEFAVAVPASARDILQGDPRVTAVRLKEVGKDTISFKPKGRAVEVPASAARELLLLLGSPTTYGFDRYSMCMFSPGVEVRLKAGDRSLRVQLCFSCDGVLFLDAGGNDISPVLAMRNSRPVLVRIAKTIFPRDREIQQLEEVR